MLKLKATTLVTMSYFSIFHPSDKCLFNSVNSCSKLFVPSFLTVDTMFATNTFFILFIIKIKIIINAVGFGSAKLTANVPTLGVSCELRNDLFSIKDKNSCET